MPLPHALSPITGQASEPWPPRLEVTTPICMSTIGSNSRVDPAGHDALPLAGCGLTGALLASRHRGFVRPETRPGSASARTACLSVIDRELSTSSTRSILTALPWIPPPAPEEELLLLVVLMPVDELVPVELWEEELCVP